MDGGKDSETRYTTNDPSKSNQFISLLYFVSSLKQVACGVVPFRCFNGGQLLYERRGWVDVHLRTLHVSGITFTFPVRLGLLSCERNSLVRCTTVTIKKTIKPVTTVIVCDRLLDELHPLYHPQSLLCSYSAGSRYGTSLRVVFRIPFRTCVYVIGFYTIKTNHSYIIIIDSI